MKYTIKNCPAYKGYCTNEFRYGQCSEISDCLLKRIVDKCKNYREKFKNNYYSKKGFEEILNLLEIEEVNE